MHPFTRKTLNIPQTDAYYNVHKNSFFVETHCLFVFGALWANLSAGQEKALINTFYIYRQIWDIFISSSIMRAVGNLAIT